MDSLPGKDWKGRLDVNDIGGKGLREFRLSGLSGKYGYEIRDYFFVPADNPAHKDRIIRRARLLEGEGNYAVRSSYPGEDSAMNSFAGIFETLLDIPEWDLADAIRKVRASARSERARKYAKERGMAIDDRMPVMVQRMVYAEIGGVFQTTLKSWLVGSLAYPPVTCTRRIRPVDLRRAWLIVDEHA